MLKALLRKEFLESFSFLFVSKKKGTRRTVGAIIGFVLIISVALFSVCYVFWEMSGLLCEPLVTGGLAWVYFAMTALIGTGLSVVGSIFTTKAKLYEAKDNDFLLSMPIPARMILSVRMISLYLFAFFFANVAFIPAVVRYALVFDLTAPMLCGVAVSVLLVPLGALAISCLLGWLIAWLASKIPAKNLVTTILSVVFFAAYFVLYSKINEYLNYVIEHGEQVSLKIKSYLYPFWKLGLACTGDWAATAVFAVLFIGAFAVIYIIIDRTYFRLATANKGRRKVKYRERTHKQRSVLSALLKNEAKRYFGNPMVVLNGFMGIFFSVAAVIFAAFNRDLVDALSKPSWAGGITLWAGGITLALCAMFGFFAASNIISSVSVSLEGKNIWLLQSMPLSARTVLFMKIIFHVLASLPVLLLSSGVFALLFDVGLWLGALLLAFVCVFDVFFAFLGLFINLKMPKLDWTSEAACVKQSGSSVIALFSAWGIVGTLTAGYFWFGKYLPAWGYILLTIGVLSLAIGAFWAWLTKRGVKIFGRLS